MTESQVKSFIKTLNLPPVLDRHLPPKEDRVARVEEQIYQTQGVIASTLNDIASYTHYLTQKDDVAVQFAEGKLRETAIQLKSYVLSLDGYMAAYKELTGSEFTTEA